MLSLLALIAAVVLTHDAPKGPLHLRLMTPQGPVHVFRPATYEASTAGTVLYVHGYYTDLGGACSHHGLPRQFRDSGLNALFIVPEAPRSATDAVAWPSLEALLDVVEAHGVERPAGRVVAVAHSGGFRTVARWLDAGILDSVVLLDGLYGAEDDFGAWLNMPQLAHRLVLVGFHTTPQIERFVAAFDDLVEVDAIPLEPPPPQLKRSRLLFVHSQFDHMALVTRGRALPAVLKLTQLAALLPR